MIFLSNTNYRDCVARPVLKHLEARRKVLLVGEVRGFGECFHNVNSLGFDPYYRDKNIALGRDNNEAMRIAEGETKKQAELLGAHYLMEMYGDYSPGKCWVRAQAFRITDRTLGHLARRKHRGFQDSAEELLYHTYRGIEWSQPPVDPSVFDDFVSFIG